MKTTVDIPDNELRDLLRHTRARTKREAIVAAITEFNRRRRMERLIEKFGMMEGFMTHEDLRRMREEP